MVGKAVYGEVHVLDAEMNEVPPRTVGKLWFKTAHPFEYYNDPEKTAAANSADRTMSTVGDICCVDEEADLSGRPRVVHDHFGRGQHLSTGVRELAGHEPARERRGCVRRAQRGNGERRSSASSVQPHVEREARDLRPRRNGSPSAVSILVHVKCLRLDLSTFEDDFSEAFNRLFYSD